MTTPIAQGPVDVNVSRQRCEYCDDTGDVHDQTGEWRGQCKCGAAEDTEERYLRETLAMLHESYAKATGPAFNPGEEWVGSGGIRCWIVSVRKYPGAMSDHVNDYGVTYRYSDGAQSEKDAWNFQVRYRHVADFKLKVAK